MSQKPFKIFYVTDIHGSEICWRKFLNAGTFYQADVVIVGGDITGKAMVPIIRRRDQWDSAMFDQHDVLKPRPRSPTSNGRSATAVNTRCG